ncbi:hypothetical protein [uncultured Gimesia sp.]|jgi:hypothetical protein|uniref:hypothetical protein n=1 Tax=uncultured Gimesia sp. TaxID=1678688 RepID=UPI0026032718|nr:hypothetical protein [uncultured Gimesia sp.]
MTMLRFVLICCLAVVFVSVNEVFAVDPEKKEAKEPTQRLYDEGVPESGFLTLKTENYTIPLDAASGWTIEKMFYRDHQFGLNNGHYGTVLRPKGEQWWGTGHKEGGREVVHRCQLIVDGREVPITKTGETLAGKRIEFIKDSTIWKFKVRAKIILTNTEIFEQTEMEALEDCELDLLYYFMHCFPPSTTKWIAQLPNGTIEQGPLSHSQKMAVTKDTTWVAQYDEKDHLGLLCYTPRVIAGNQSASHIWDLDRYHKYYLRHNNGQSFKKGEKLDFTVLVKAVPHETGDWNATKKAAAELMKQFPVKK